MPSLNTAITAYKEQLQLGLIQQAYRGIMEFMNQLRLRLKHKYPDYSITNSIYQGYMDTSYFALTPPELRSRKLKIAIIFKHESCSFEVWLAGANKKIQKQYWNEIRERGWQEYRIPESIKGVHSIVEYTITEIANFDDFETLCDEIEQASSDFIKKIIEYLVSS